jgi:hypothetical protein
MTHARQEWAAGALAATDAVVAVYPSHAALDEAITALQRSRFDMKKLSIVGKDYYTDQQVVGYYNAGDRMKYWGKLGAFWGGLWGCSSERRSSGCRGSERFSSRGRWPPGSSPRWKVRWSLAA